MNATPPGKVRPRKYCHHEAGHAFVRWFFGSGLDCAGVLTRDQVARREWGTDSRGRVRENCAGFVDGCDVVSWNVTRASMASHFSAEEVRRTEALVEISLMVDYAGISAEANYRKCCIWTSMLNGGGSDMRDMRATIGAWFADDPDIWVRTARRTTALIRSKNGQAAVKAIADELERVGEISGAVIADLCKTAFDGRKPVPGAWIDHWPPTLEHLRASHLPARLAAAPIAQTSR